MEREEVLKTLIRNTGLSMRAFAENAGIPNTTLHSMLERGIGKASVDNVIKVCKTLNITVEQLNEMARNNSLTPLNKENDAKEVDTLAAHLEGKNITPQKMKLLEKYIDALFDNED